MTTKLDTKLPKDNGLNSIDQQLVANDEVEYVVVGLIGSGGYNHDPEDGDVPKARFKAIEVINDHGPDEKAVRKILGKAYKERTGVAELPLDGDDSD